MAEFTDASPVAEEEIVAAPIGRAFDAVKALESAVGNQAVNPASITGRVTTLEAVDPLVAANNLSDLASAATARTNLGVSAFGINVKESPYSAVPSGTVDSSAQIQAALNASPHSTVSAEGGYAIAHPIIVPVGVTFKGSGGMQAGSQLLTTAAFYNSTVTGAQTTPALSTTPFTLTVASTALAPLGVGGIVPPGGHGVLCVSGITIFYTGTTATTFTGCHVGDIDVSVTIPNAAAVSTFMVWLGDPGSGNPAPGARIENFDIHCGTIPGISGVHSGHVQEGGGIYECNISGYRNFGIRLDQDTAAVSLTAPGQWDIHGLWMRCSGSGDSNMVDIDIVGMSLDRNISGRGIRDVTIVNNDLTTGPFTGLAGLRLNGTTGSFSDFHLENHNIGVLVGDKLACSVTLENINQDFNWGTGSQVELGNTVGNSASVRNLFVGGTGTGGTLLVDHVNSNTYVANTVAAKALTSYTLYSDGTWQVNGGERYGPVANRPTASTALAGATWIDVPLPSTIALTADNVAGGARDNSSSSTLTVTFTATTTIGHHVLLAAAASDARTLSSITDSRGNTWQVDKVSAVVPNVTANAASCYVTIAHQIGDTLTLTFSGANSYAAAICSEWSGLSSTSWVDVVATNAGDSSGGEANTGVMPLRTQPADLVFGAAAYVNATNEGAGVGSWTALTTKSSGAGVRKVTPLYKIVSVAVSEAINWDANAGGYETVGVAYKAAWGALALSMCDGYRWVSSAAAYQPVNANLTTLGGLTATTDNFIVSVASAWASRTPAQVKTTLALDNVSNTSDATKNAAVATLTNKTLTSPVVNSPTGIVKGDVGLGNVDNTSNATERAATATLTNKTLTSPAITSPTGIAKGDVGLGNVDNTSDATKATTEATAVRTLTNKTLTAPVINSPTGIVKGDVSLGNVDNTSNATERAATATLTNKTLTSPAITSPTGIVKGDVGLGNVDNVADASKPVSTAQAAADVLAAQASTVAVAQTAHGLSVGNAIKFSGTTYSKAQADTAANAEVVGVVSVVTDANNFTLVAGGRITTLSGLTAATTYFLSAATAGLLTATEPSTVGQVSVPVVVATSSTAGYVVGYRGAAITAAGTLATDPLYDAKGDIAVATSADTAAKLSVGANDTIPMADSAQTTGIKWGTPSTVKTALALNNVTNVAQAPASLTINAQTGNGYTLVLADANSLVTLSNASAQNLVVPTNASVAFPIGTIVNLASIGAGLWTVTGAGPPTVSGTPGLKLRAQYSQATLVKTATDTWLLSGDLSA